MDLDLGADSVQYVSWKAQEKKWSVDGEESPLTAFLIEPQSYKEGLGRLQEGVAPDWIWKKSPGERQEPMEHYKKAFYLDIYLSKKHGAPVSEWREWTSNQRASRDALMSLFQGIDKKDLDKGKLMKVNVKGSQPKKFGPATVNVPVLEFDSWVDNPDSKEPVEKILSDDLEDEIDWG